MAPVSVIISGAWAGDRRTRPADQDPLKQFISQVQPLLVITTGTAGGIGGDQLLGDVVVSGRTRWDATHRCRQRDPTDLGAVHRLLRLRRRPHQCRLRTYQPDARAVEMDDAALGPACTDLMTPRPGP